MIAWPLAASILSRLPAAALGLVLLLHARALGGSYALAGAVTASFGVGLAAGAPLLGRVADRRGGPLVLAGTTFASVLALCALAALPGGAAPAALLALAAVAGLVHPPVAGIVRSAWPRLLARAAAERIYAVESSALELTYIAGPALLGGAVAAHSTRLALVLSAVLLVTGAAAMLGNGALRRATAVDPHSGPRPLLGALDRPGVVVLALAFACLGASLGAVEVAVAAAAGRAGHQPLAGVLLAVWGLGSLLGGAAMVHRPPRGDARRRLVLLTALSALLHGSLVAVVPLGLAPLGAALLIAGFVVAPGFATAYGLMARIAPAGSTAEAFSWLSTGIAIGAAAGSAVAGLLTDGPGPQLAFLAGGLAPLLAAALLWARRRDLAAG